MLQVYRIDRSLFGRIGHFFKKPDLPVLGTGLFGNPLQVFKEVTTANCYILSEDEEVARFHNPLGERLLDDVYYIRHPKAARTNCLIPATSYHSYVIGEQIADLVSYIRANSSVKRLHVSIVDAAGARLAAKGVIDERKVEGEVDFKYAKRHEVLIDCARPLKPSEKRRDYVWMEDFESTRAAVDQMGEGSVEIRQGADLSLGLEAKVADMIGVSGEFRKNWEYRLRCELA